MTDKMYNFIINGVTIIVLIGSVVIVGGFFILLNK